MRYLQFGDGVTVAQSLLNVPLRVAGVVGEPCYRMSLDSDRNGACRRPIATPPSLLRTRNYSGRAWLAPEAQRSSTKTAKCSSCEAMDLQLTIPNRYSEPHGPACQPASARPLLPPTSLTSSRSFLYLMSVA